MDKILISAVFAATLFAGLLVCLRLGWMIGRRRSLTAGEDAQAGLGAIDGSVFGLMGLLIAFTFTGAANRFHDRRELITQHTNAIGTAWLRLDLLTGNDRAKARDGFRRYLDTVLEITRDVSDKKASIAGLARLNAIQQEIWDHLVDATKRDRSLPLAQTVLPPANEMFDLGNSRILASRQHPPVAVFAMLGALVLVSGLFAGFGMAKCERQSPLHVLGFAAIMALSIYLILDIEYPRLGFVRIDAFDQALIELRATMN
ncbi:MAG: DUF4239 domain-containing protein [Akkermansiaceae bacterium]|jgi:hypothetical protein|nr:DUF4239 domain-containing protein [Akkermansiaceae bacterium]